MAPQTYSIQETADLLGVSAMTITRRADTGEIPTITVGKRRLVPRSYVAQLFENAGYPLQEEAANASA